MFGYAYDEPVKRLIIFLDPKGTLYTADSITEDSEPEWDLDTVRSLADLMNTLSTSVKHCRFLLMGSTQKMCTISGLQDVLKKYKLDTYLADDMENYITPESISCAEKAALIQSYLQQHDDIVNYAIVENTINSELELHFQFHCVFAVEKLEKVAFTRIHRKLSYGIGFETNHEFSKHEEYEDDFKKVIFLDIDGVLNKAYTCGYDNVEKVELEFIDNLAEIVRQTGAEIILSSSWRYGLLRSEKEPLSDTEKRLFKAMADRQLYIAGATPIIRNGPDGRPFEIRRWLSKRSSIKSFVILDDETFWSWNWLAPFVVTTSFYVTGEDGVSKHRAGLEKQFIAPAVRILNQFN